MRGCPAAARSPPRLRPPHSLARPGTLIGLLILGSGGRSGRRVGRAGGRRRVAGIYTRPLQLGHGMVNEALLRRWFDAFKPHAAWRFDPARDLEGAAVGAAVWDHTA